jgi:hypothetical protein
VGRAVHGSAASEVDAHRPLGKAYPLASILSHVEQRVIRPDYTIRYDGGLYQVVREQIRPRLKGRPVRVEKRLDGVVAVQGPEGPLRVQECVDTVGLVPAVGPAKVRGDQPRRRSSRSGNRRWMYGFDLNGGPSLEEVVANAYRESREEGG